MGALATVVAPLRTIPRLGALIFLLAASFGWFVDPPGWNQNSRLALTRALVEDQSTIIDAYAHTTGDKSFRDGHYYCDKAPGMSVLATIPYAGFYLARRATGRGLPSAEVVVLDPLDRAAGRVPAPTGDGALMPGDRLHYDRAHRIALYVCRMLTSSLLTCLGLAAFYLLALRQLDRPRPALAATLAFGLATPAFVYGAAFYGHAPCGALLLIAFALVHLLPDDAGPSRVPPLVAGACLGLAVTIEYPAAVPVALITAWAAWARGPRFAAWMAAGGLPFAAALGLYHQVAFGHPLSTGYDYVYLERFAEGMAQSYGLGPPDLEALLALTFGSYRGLFYVAPVLLLAVWGLGVRGCSTPAADGFRPLDRPALALSVTVVAYYLLLNSGYYMWDGGAATGPRHSVPMLGFLALGLVPVTRLLPRALAVLAGVSAIQMLAAAAVSPEAPQWGDPIWGHAMARLLSGDSTHATSVGDLLGLSPIVGLLPLLGLWIWLWPLRASSFDLEPHV